MAQPIDRRAFLQSGTMAAILGGAGAVPASAGPNASPTAYQEPAREVPIVEQAGVVICGAGPAGVAAAIAARTGAKTRLLEVNGCLGGVWTAGTAAAVAAGTGRLPQDIPWNELRQVLEKNRKPCESKS